MACGSTLTLYKKFNIKSDVNFFNTIIQQYANHNKEHDYSQIKREDSYYEKDIPLIMSVDPFRKESIYDEKQEKWIDIKPEKTIENARNYTIGHIDSRDMLYCDKMMEWSFNSSFDCLVEKYDLGHYGFASRTIEITIPMAEKMCEAVNYILGGEWSDKVERGMNNEFIKVFTDGYNCDSYWKYIYRNRNNTKKKTFKIKQDGYEIEIKCPYVKENKSGEEFLNEALESDENIEYNLSMLRVGLETFLKADNWNIPVGEDRKWYADTFEYKYMLTYEFWG